MALLTDITLGQYFPIDSFIHRLDPRAKLFAVFTGMTMLLLSYQPIELFIIVILVAVGIIVARLPVSLVLRNLRPFLWLFLITIFIHVLFSEGTPLVTIPYLQLTISKQGIINGGCYSIRLALLIIFSALLTLTTSTNEITDALGKIIFPLKRLGFPSHDLIMIINLSLRFIPTLIMEADKLRKAQISRGITFGGNVYHRIKSILPLVLPLFLSIFRRADELALAMDARCYTGGDDRTSYTNLSFKKQDYYILIGFVVLFIIFLARQI